MMQKKRFGGRGNGFGLIAVFFTGVKDGEDDEDE